MTPRILACIFLASIGTGLPAAAQNASLTLIFTNNGAPLDDPLHGKFYVYEVEQRDKYVAWGHAGKPARFPAGTYDVVIRYQNDQVRRERTVEEWELEGDVAQEVEFFAPVARMTVEITSGGAAVPAHRGSYSLHRAGQRGKPLVSRRPGEPVTIEPGVYDIEVAFRDIHGLQTTWLTEYHLEGQRRESVELGQAMARFQVTLTENGVPLSPDRASWRATEPGRRSVVVGEARSGEALDLPVGSYDIGLFYSMNGEPTEQWLAEVDVSGEQRRDVEIVRTTTTVEVAVRHQGTLLRDAWYSLYRAGGRGTALASGRSGSSVQVSPGIYDVRAVFRDGGIRSEAWLRDRRVERRSRIDVELELNPATLRIMPPRGRGQNGRRGTPKVLVVLDSSLDMRAGMGGGSRLDVARRGLLDAAPILQDAGVEFGLRVFGIAPRAQQDCRDSSLLIPPAPLQRRRLATTLDLTRPAGLSPIGYSLERARGDLPAGTRGTLVLLTGSVEGCGGNPCSAAAGLLRGGHADKVYVVGLGLGRTAGPELECAGIYRQAGSRGQLRSVLREIFRDAARDDQGTVSAFLPDGGEWVTSGNLGDTLELSAGRYDLLIRTGDRTHRWPGFRVVGDTQAVAGPKP